MAYCWDKQIKFDLMLKKLTFAEKKMLCIRLEEVSESSYRRGVHQALEFEWSCPERFVKNFKTKLGLYKWRFTNKKKCIGLDGYKSTIASRLFCEHYWLEKLVKDRI